VDLAVERALERIAARDEGALMFGTDLPSVRARRSFSLDDVALVERVLGAAAARAVLHDNAARFYLGHGRAS
jgi:predicted TIM-barrel fold metal-dependent hydrolase